MDKAVWTWASGELGLLGIMPGVWSPSWDCLLLFLVPAYRDFSMQVARNLQFVV